MDELNEKILEAYKRNILKEDYKSNPVDAWLIKNGWEETHGIALYTNLSKHPGIGVDTNSGNAAIEVFTSKNKIFNEDGALIDYTNKPQALSKAIENGDIVYAIWKEVRFMRKYRSKTLSRSAIRLHAEGYGVAIYLDENILVTLSGYNVKGSQGSESPWDANYKARFPFKKNSVNKVVKQIEKWEKEQGLK